MELNIVLLTVMDTVIKGICFIVNLHMHPHEYTHFWRISPIHNPKCLNHVASRIRAPYNVFP